MIKQIGKYQILEEIGRGGFGRVYRCFDPTVGRVVALKLLLPDATDPEHLGRFRMEAATTGNLRHKNLVVIHEFGEQDGLQYLVMEFLEGEDLQKRMQAKAASPLLEKIEIMQQVAVGLHCAHESGVVHRDVKPSNIMLLRDGTVKVMDFGIARLTRADSTRLTKTGYLVGTLNYMSPEQFRDGDVDPLCDIWAYGVIYYEFLTGKHPFDAATTPGLMYAITNQEPKPMATLAPNCPPALERIILRAMTKERDLRYQSLEDLHMDVEPILLDLRRERAKSLLPEAYQLFEQQRWEETQALVRRILDLNPMETEARALRERISQQSHQKAIQPKILSLRKTGEEHLRNRRFGEAIHAFESAARLDPGNAELKAAVESAKAAVERSRRAGQLLEAALGDLRNEQLTSANRNAAEASRLDPDNPGAADVIQRLREAIDDRSRRSDATSALDRARALVDARAHPEALALLRDIEQRYPETPGLPELLAQAEQIREEEMRRARRDAGLRAAWASLRANDPPTALQQLQRLRPEFAADPEVIAVQQQAQEQLQKQAREKVVAAALERAKRLLGDKDLDGAEQVLERAAKESRGDAALSALLQECRDTRTRQRTEAAIQQAVQSIESQRQAADFSKAQAALAQARQQFGTDARLLALQQSVEQDLGREARRAALRQNAAEIRTLLTQKQYPEAVAKAEAWIRQWGTDPEIEELRGSAQRLGTEARLRESRHALLERVRTLEAAGQRAEALRVLDGEISHYSGDAELADVRRSLLDRLERERQEHILADKVRQVEAALTANQLDRAAVMLSDLQRTHPAESALPRLSERLRQVQDENDIVRSTEEIQKALTAQNLNRAGELLATALRNRPQEPRFLKLQQQVDAEQSIAESVAQAYRLLAENKPDLAETSARALLTLRNDHAAIRKLRGDIETARQKLQKEHQKTLAELAAKLAKGQFEDVIAISGRSLTLNPEDQELRNYIDRAEIGLRDAQRQRQAQLVEAERRQAEAEAARRRAAMPAPVPIQLQPAQPPMSSGPPLVWIAVAVLLAASLAGGGYWAWWSTTSRPSNAWRLTTEKLSLRWQIGQPDLATAEVGVVGAKPGEEFIASSETPWLNLVATQIQTPEAFRAVLSPGKLEPGTYQGRMVVKNAAGSRSQGVQVELTVAARTVKPDKQEQTESSIRVDVSELQFQVRRGDATAEAKAIRVTGTGVSTVRVSIPLGADWFTVDRPDGVLPATLWIRPKSGALGIGQHTGMVQITSAQNQAVVTRVNVKIRVEEAVKPVDPPPVVKPPVIEPKIEPVVPPKLPDRSLYTGPSSGKISWSLGELAPGQSLTLGPTGVLDGGKGIVRGRLPGEIPVEVEVKPPTVTAEVDSAYRRVVIVNKGTTAVRAIEISWKVK